MNIFTSTVTNLTKSNEQLELLDNEITEKVSKLNEVQNGVRKKKTENNKVIEKINALLS